MGSVVSSENEGPPDDLCRVCGHPWERHTTSLPEEGREEYCTECFGEEQEYHAFVPACSSVHAQGEHCYHASKGGCCSCSWKIQPPSADAEAAGEPEAHPRSGYRDADEAASMYPKPEAPECDGCGHALHVADQCSGQTFGERCECDEPLSLAERIKRTSEKPEFQEMVKNLDSSGPIVLDMRRPPYAVAYAIEGGAQYEIALPGDATVRAVDGALVITHDKPVLAMGQVRPMEGA